MSLRAPRRRISPRTKRRYRAIRNFLRRALGTASQPDDNKTNSNISVSISDLKHKIVGIEKQLDQVSQHCRDLITVNDDSTCVKPIRTRQNSENSISLEKNLLNSKPETKVLYKTSENQLKKFVESDVPSKVSVAYCVDVGKQQQNIKNETKIVSSGVKYKRKIKHCKNELSTVNEYDSDLNRRKNSLAYETAKICTASYCSTVHKTDPSLHRQEKKRPRKDYNKPVVTKKSHKTKGDRNSNNIQQFVRKYEDRNDRNRYRKEKKELDNDFINDIIRRQYEPVKLFNRRTSGFSQLSAPLCRDQDFSVHENIQEGSELCSCCYDEPAIGEIAEYSCSLSDVRSVYNYTKKYPRYRQVRKNQEYYNDSFYDLVPVKEKSSPKTRKKFIDHNMIPYDNHKEVPPSPRSMRPRLNLKAQRHEVLDDLGPYVAQTQEKDLLDTVSMQKLDKNVQNNGISNFIIERNNEVMVKATPELEVSNNLDDTYPNIPHPTFGQNPTNLLINDLAINKIEETSISVDKSDKALYEIKDILQTFLEEMKRETAQSDKSELSNKSMVKTHIKRQHNENSNIPIDPNSFVHSNITAQCTANCINGFPNNCCYPVLPVCPVNCVQNGFPPVVLPNQSYTCTACTSHCKESTAKDNKFNIPASSNTKDKTTSDNTQQLIKEIYDYVTQSPTLKHSTKYRDVCIDNSRGPEPEPAPNKELTSRSAGASSNPSLHDVIIGTSQMKCYSKSCEALEPNNEDDIMYSNESYSDTVMEKVSLEAAAAKTSDFDFSSILDVKVKPTKKTKFSKVLKTFGSLLKKRKKDMIEELSESYTRSTEEEDVTPPSPYRQQVTNYMMHGEEYYHQPPLLPRRAYPPRSPEEIRKEHRRRPSGIDSRNVYPHLPFKHAYDPYPPMMYDPALHYGAQYPGTSPSYSTTFDPRYSPTQPQVPLCLKEIEVKSMGTQSEKKKSFLEILKEKMAGPKPQIDPIEEAKGHVARMTKRTGLLNWKHPEKELQMNAANLNLTYKLTQQQLAETDMTIRNAMMKRFFKKRNPFSARNPVLQTLLGKDKPMAEPPNLLRPRMMV